MTQPPGETSGGQTPIGGWDNPADPLEEDLPSVPITGATGPGGVPLVGDTLSVQQDDFVCAGQVCWSKVNKNTGVETDISCQNEPISGSWDLSITSSEIDHYIVATGRCKDPSTPDGFGAPITLATIGPVPDYAQYNWQLTDQTGAGPVVSSIVIPAASAPYACFLNGSNTTCLIDIQTTNCNLATVSTTYFISAPLGQTPAFTVGTPLKTADCP